MSQTTILLPTIIITGPGAIVRAVGRVNTSNRDFLRAAAAVLIFFMKFVLDCQIRAGHDEIMSAFEEKTSEILHCGFLGVIDLELLRTHIAAEKARCEQEAADLGKARRIHENDDLQAAAEYPGCQAD